MILGINRGRKEKVWLHPVWLIPVKNSVRDIEFRKPCQSELKSIHIGGFFCNRAIVKACILAPYECGKDNCRLEEEKL